MDEPDVQQVLTPRSREEMRRLFDAIADGSKNQRVKQAILDVLLDVAAGPISVGELNYTLCVLFAGYTSDLKETRSFELLMSALLPSIVAAMIESEDEQQALLATFIGTPYEAITRPPSS